ncbi:MAG: asparagine--tRNA ligase [Candidatus Staskawiczbacteria bacterium RIFOXYB2_FULL_32_9]|uniref:Asparagine--tRNA ligase n=1 Tax=Candidatus Staskawiczbacteria bacterium RIFOXYD1_FULL_32_13 TaxID=1802234 RepID=A0A1G2JLW0_9BACT|nr:MAG: asparagine--tRNA ligase [Candidatus Staskawiczbacteria bacterium RIFOXYB1_FULL_32_11]OGZ83947.1 MAG: asparagine--tRNA ligase [Candidatus Staskawiczbacteria bacterium RIFOXYB2_FULL_32_9]OGZ86091.1 MAG: asparagine--tRNA ligase [Candidatus Staskawiczbacteria bacterium RIFOXYC2_FULL_32_10]OGZ87451.1 MAG: asparagine--tRNA ligase [Candidatus Staskawiczbacteria bacterium RIFOXYD1_FULL_32_13]
MEKILITNIAKYVGEEVELDGWVANFRSSGKIAFWQIRDGSGFCQAILDVKSLPENVWKESEKVTLESSVKIIGIVAKHPKKEEYELQVKDFSFYQIAKEYPISKKDHGPDFLLDNRHLWLRSSHQWAIQRIRNTLILATYEYFNQNNFIKIDSPILTPSACEGTTELFEIDYFGERKAYLSQSGQLYLEAAIFAHGKVFDFGPVFRAEKSKTRRHLTEFWMMDAEMAFVDLKEMLKIEEELIRYMVKSVLEKNQQELAILERDVKPLENILKPFYKITHTEAVKKLQELGSDIKEGDDMGADDETILTKQYDNPIFVTHYPKEVKAFYMKRNPDDNSRVLCADLLAPEGYGEIIGGSQREDDFDALLERIKAHNLPQSAFEWYLDLRKYGSVPHSGFGFGLERITAWVCGIAHIRETIPFPRTINRLTP